jgi:hypothetical protein
LTAQVSAAELLGARSFSWPPGTAIGFRNEYSAAHDVWTWWGFDLREGSTFVSRGLPDRPNTFVDVQLVQEQPAVACVAAFLPDFWPSFEGYVAPALDWRFSHFYAPAGWYHLWSGYDEGYFDYAVSPDSLVTWVMRDCRVYGGRINLGNPDDGWYFGASWDDYYGVGAVTWVNNLFENVSVNLDPTYYWVDGVTMNCDLRVEARHNLFRGGRWFHLEPVPASAGNWVMTDNLFDKVNFVQNTNAPLDFDYNGYWPLTQAELDWLWYYYPWYAPNSGRLLATTNGGGSHEPVLTAPPPYETGPLGKYYLPVGTALYHAGSTNASEAGLWRYTTRVDQLTEGEEPPSGHNVNIGLHSVAATNLQPSTCNVQPRDTDGDGIADYVEDANGDGLVDGNETSPLLMETTAGVLDSTNSVYDDTDLSGNGMAGRIKKALGLGPLEMGNPLTLTQIVTGEEPDFVTFEVPVSYEVVTNAGTLKLNMNGIGVTLEECTRATNGNCRLSFNVDYDPAGLHYLSGGFRLWGGAATERAVMTASGQLLPFYSSNTVQFFESGSMFDEAGAYLDAKLFVQEADYTIGLYDPATAPPTLILSLTNTSSNGVIREDWGVTNADGTPYTGLAVNAVFNIMPAGGNPGDAPARGPTKFLTKAIGSLSEGGPNMNVVYFYTPTNNAMEAAHAKGGVIWDGMQRVVDALIQPRGLYEVYQSWFNRYLPDPNGEYPGYITKRVRTTGDPTNLPTVLDTLLPDLTNGVTKQIYIHGHGNDGWMGNGIGDVWISSADVSAALRNTFSKTNLTAHNSYRFVWLDGCLTASGPLWRRAFGIYPIDADSQDQAARNNTGPQAYVGWADVHTGWFNRKDNSIASRDLAEGYCKTLQVFHTYWMNGWALRYCLDKASEQGFMDRVPIPVPSNRRFTVTLNGHIYTCTNVSTSKIHIVGFPGLQVKRTDHGLDLDTKYAAPKNIE